MFRLRRHVLLLTLLVPIAACSGLPAPPVAWPQGPGPNGNWTATGPEPPLSFSGTTGHNIVWRTPLPETGQGGIAIANGRVFVATMAPWTGEGLDEADAKRYAHAIERRKVVGKHIDAHCLEGSTGEILWTRRIEGEVPSIYSYPFSDATSASPCADDEHVWFTNAGGKVVCFTHAGDEVWSRSFHPTYDGPFNKQFEPFLVADPQRGAGAKTLVQMEPREKGADSMGAGQPRWHFLIGLDAHTGAELWCSEDALTHYNAPILVAADDGPCVLHARGGPHDVPERPVGVSLTRVTGKHAGKRVWRYEDARGNHEGALQTMACDQRFVYWLLREPRNVLVVLDRTTGEQLREISLVQNVRVTTFDATADSSGNVGGFRTTTCDLDKGVFPARYSMHAANGRVYFQCYSTAFGKPTLAVPYSFGCIDPTAADDSPAVHYVEVPTFRDPVSGESTWRTRLAAKAIDSRGEEVTGDERSHWDGWDWVFNGSPTQVNDRLYFTLATGLVYVLDVGAATFGPEQLLAVDDLGVIGAIWTANSVSYSAGRLFHRTARELLCIGDTDRPSR